MQVILSRCETASEQDRQRDVAAALAVFSAAGVSPLECFNAVVKRELIDEGPMDDIMSEREGDLAYYWDMATDAGLRACFRCGPKDPLPDGCLSVVE